MLIRAEKRRRDEGKNIRGWYLRDNEWKKSTGTEKDDFESEYCIISMRVSIEPIIKSIVFLNKLNTYL